VHLLPIQFTPTPLVTVAALHALTDVVVKVNALYARQTTLHHPGVKEEVLVQLSSAYEDLRKALPPGDAPLSPLFRKVAVTCFYLYGACLSSQPNVASQKPILLALGLLLEEQESSLKGTQLLKNLLRQIDSLYAVGVCLGTFSNQHSLEAYQLIALEDVLNRMSKDVFIQKVAALDEEKAFETLLALRWLRFDLRPLDFATAARLASDLMQKAKTKIPEHKWLVAQIRCHFSHIFYPSGDIKGMLQELDNLNDILSFLDQNPDTLLCQEFKAHVHEQFEKRLSLLGVYSTEVTDAALQKQLDQYGKTPLERLQIRYQEIVKAVTCADQATDGFYPDFRNTLLQEAIVLALQLKREDPNCSLDFKVIGGWVRRLTQVVEAVDYRNTRQQKWSAEEAYSHVIYCKTAAEYAIACGNFDEAEEQANLGMLIYNQFVTNPSAPMLWIKKAFEDLQAELNRPYMWIRRKIVPIALQLAKELVVQIALFAQMRLFLSLTKLPKAQAESIGKLEKGVVIICAVTLFASRWMSHLGFHLEKPYIRRSGMLHAIEKKEGKLAALAALVVLAVPAFFTAKAFALTK